jgi:hypothetical protein
MSAKLTLGVLRAMVGIGTWLFPAHSAQIFGLKRPDDVQILAWRLFASREMVFAFFALSNNVSQETTTMILQGGIFLDSLDAIATLIAYNRTSISSYAGVMIGIGAVFFAGLGVLSLPN